ncbi:MAG: carboxypeptidase-like regulatory domain-containing protein, partial [Planctomycetota bacterium]|nr:carboxypeptidase-like regulatory domain-containing protein [Planctomycetota bacterium]
DQPTPFMSKLLTCIEIADLLATQEGAEQPLYRMPPIPTDATGRAVLPGLPPGPIDAMVLHDDYIGARLRDLRAEGTHKVRLQSGGSVKVVARSLDGESTVGAYVEVIAAGAFSIPRGIARIDANGEAVVQNIKAGAYRVTVSREGTSFLLRGMGSDENEEAEKPVVLSRRTEVQTGKQTIVDFSVTTGCTVCGVMFDTDGDPVELAHVWICRTGSHETVRTTIEGDGSFVFTSVMPGAYEAFGGTLDGTLAKQSFRVDPGATRVEIALRPGTATLTGTVELADGTLAKDMKVLLVKKYRSGHFLDLDTDLTVLAGLAGRDSTDKQGTGQFTIRGLGPGAYRVLFGYDKTCCVEDIELREGEARSIRLRYDKRGLFRLRVHGIDAADKTVPTKLLLRGADGHYGLVHAFNLDTEPKSAHEFRLPRGRYRIVAHSSGFAAVQDRVVELKADRDVKLRFEPIRAFRLQLRRDGRPVANEAVDIRTEHGARAGLGSTLLDVVMTPTDFRTDEAGSITLTGLEQGLYRIRSGSRVIGEFRIDGEAENAVVELR